MQEAQRRKDRRTRALIISAGAIIAAVLITIGVVAITNVQKDDAAKGANLEKVVEPAGVSETGGIAAAGPDGAQPPVKVVEYLDYQCPACAQFDLTVGPYLKEQVAAGAVELEYHPLGYLDQFSSGTRYSTRSANAAYCVAGSDGGDIVKFSDTLYAQQPPENANGLPDADLVKAAKDAGAGDDVEKCITSETHSGYVTEKSQETSELEDGKGQKLVQGTPTVVVGGDVVANPTIANVQAAIEGATK